MLAVLFFVDTGAICVLQRPLAHSPEKVYSELKKFTKGWGCVAMISPKNVRVAAEKREDENLRFRTFLKIHADPNELDRQFLALHRELFDGYDCCQCGNCCREYSTSLSEDEIVSISAYLGMTRQKVLEDCLIRGRDGLELPAPCRFLDMDGRCRLQECKPEECRGFPYTDRPNRMMSLLSVISAARVCPVAYEILARLKELYHFRKHRR